MIYQFCINYDGDEDCHKCVKRGYIFECPPSCKDGKDVYGRKIEGRYLNEEDSDAISERV